MNQSTKSTTSLLMAVMLVLSCGFASAVERKDAELADATKQRLEQLVADNAFVAEVKLEPGEFTGAFLVHKTNVRTQLKDKLKTGALFSHLDGADATLPPAIEPPKKPMSKLPAGEYVVIVYGVEIINSFPGIRVPLIGVTIMKPKRSYNYFIQRDGTQHCAWQTNSPEAQYLRELTRSK